MKKAPHFLLLQGEDLTWKVHHVYPDSGAALEALRNVIQGKQLRAVVARVIPSEPNKKPRGKPGSVTRTDGGGR